MVIFLSSELLSGVNKSNPPQRVLDSLENLARCKLEGKHIIISSRPSIDKILEVSNLPNRSKEIYRLIGENSTTKMDIRNHVSHVLNVVKRFSDINVTGRSPANINVPLNHFSDSVTIQKTTLLVENRIDAKIHVNAGHFFARERNIGFIEQCDIRQGGGYTTYGTFNDLQKEQKKPVLCVVDSDRIHPDDKFGKTAKKVSAKDSDDYPLAHLHIIEAHEIENLVPSNFFIRNTNENTDERKAARSIEVLDSSDSLGLIRLYIDTRKGTSLADVIEAYKKREDVNLQILASKMDSINEECLASTQCENPNSCTCIINNPIGKNNTSVSVDQAAESKVGHIREHASGSLSDAWMKVGSIVFSWLCGSTPVRS